MPNPITDAGHEYGDPVWEFPQPGATRVNDAAAAHDGVWYVKARIQTGAGAAIARFGQQFTIPDSSSRRLRMWIREELAASSNYRLFVQLYRGHVDVAIPVGTVLWQQEWMANGGVPSSWTEYDSGLVAPGGTQLTVIAWTQHVGGPFEVDEAIWYLDDWSYLTTAEIDGLAKRRDIRESVKTACQGITVANGHAVTVASVVTDLARHDKIVDWPQIQVVYGDEERSHHQMQHMKQGQLELHCLVWAKDTDTMTAEQQCDEISTSIEKELETPQSAQHLGLGYVDNVVITSIEPFKSDSDATRGVELYDVVALVTYSYDRTSP